MRGKQNEESQNYDCEKQWDFKACSSALSFHSDHNICLYLFQQECYSTAFKMPNQTNNSGNHYEHVSTFLVLQLVSFCVIAVVAVIGNALICWIELTRQPLKSSGYFIINLAISDLAVGLLSIPFDIVERLSGGWPFFPFMCNVVYPFQTLLMAVSVVTLLCMSLERYRAVLTPFKCKPTGRFIVRVILSVWFISILLVIPYTLVLKMKDGNCVEDWPSQDHVKIYTLSVFTVLYLLPLALITLCYTKICLSMHNEAVRWKSMIRYYGLSIRKVRQISNARHRQNIKIVKVFVAAVMAFALCQLPTHVIWLWHDFGTGSQWKYLTDVLPFCHILTYLNSAIDPFIFGSLEAKIISKKFRSLLKRSRRSKNGVNKPLLLSVPKNKRDRKSVV